MNRFKNDIQQAIVWLDRLIEARVPEEAPYQYFFEENPVVFQVLGYRQQYSFTKSSGRELTPDITTGLKPEPDFIVKSFQNIYEIFEIKTPVLKKLVLDSNEYRIRFTSEVNNYVSQTVTYDNYFTRNPANRQALKDQYGIDLQQDLDIKIIIGLNEYVDKAQVHQLCRRFTHKIDILTYDDILERLMDRYEEEYGLFENKPGFSFHFVVRLHENKEGGRGFILDVGQSPLHDRVAFYLDEHKEICLALFDSKGRSYEVSVAPNEEDFFDKWIYLVGEIGFSDGGLYLALSIDGNEKEERQKNVILDRSMFHLRTLFLGSDMEKESFGHFDVAEHYVYERVLNLKEKYQLLEYVLQKHDDLKTVKSWIHFDGSKHMFRNAEGHMIQPEFTSRPIYNRTSG